MDFGPHQIQLFATMLVVLSASFVALVCDLLKSNNEHLREQNVELKVRREEEQRRYELMLANATAQAEAHKAEAARVEQVPAAAQGAETKVRLQRVVRGPDRRRVSQEAVAVMERGAQMASSRSGPVEMPPLELSPEPVVAAAQEVEIEHVGVHQSAERGMEQGGQPMELVLGRASAESMEAAGSTSFSRDWSSLLNRRAPGPDEPGEVHAPQPPAGRTDLLAAVVAATDSTKSAEAASAAIPPGFQDGFVLRQLVEQHQPVSGLVVSIGVSAQDVEATPESEAAEAVRKLVESLLGPDDFAAQSGEEEYLLICPGERGAAAQRRLSEIAQQLWDFQLRCMGKYSVLFSWGGVEVRSESITEAIASATERMQETRRGRKLLSMEPEAREALPTAV
jgi:hypothetical protein